MNPAFDVTMTEARDELRAMREDPRDLDRPVVVLSGIYDPGLIGWSVVRSLDRISTDAHPVIGVAFPLTWSFDACRDHVFDVVDRKLGIDGEAYTGEVDVVGLSMGGLVARYCTMPRAEDGRSLDIRRLYTVASPHRGARLAGLAFFDARARDMNVGSPFLVALDAHRREHPMDIVAYARLDDMIVGEHRSAPTGQQSYWVATPFGEFGHLSSHRDARILADIARRLRGEPPLTAPMPGPLPTDEELDAGEIRETDDGDDANRSDMGLSTCRE